MTLKQLGPGASITCSFLPSGEPSDYEIHLRLNAFKEENRMAMERTTTHSGELYSEARLYMPAGVNSPVRAFKAVGGTPVYLREGRGSRVIDVDGNEYIDYLASWGPLILGHSRAEAVQAISEAAAKGTSFGAPHEGEVRIARLIREFFPSIEMMRLVNSGTEAVMSALRVARGFTGRPRIVKFEGCYHGHSDFLLVKAGSGLMTFDVPDSCGVPAETAQHTTTLPYNDIEAFRHFMDSHGDLAAAVIVEPVAGNMGVVPPVPGFLEALREETEHHKALLIFDEVITGFRVAAGGMQQRTGIIPDMTVLGKIAGGGLPIGVYGGKKSVMELVAPEGPVYQAGTLSGNPVAVAAGVATLEILKKTPNFYDTLEERTSRLTTGLDKALKARGIPHRIHRVASMFTLFFIDRDITDYGSVKNAKKEQYARFFHSALQRGLYFPPSQFETAFVSSAHTEEDIDSTLCIIEDIISEL